MRRRLNVKLLAIVFGSLLLVGIGVHFLHAYQLKENAYRLLERGDRAFADKEYDKAQGFYGQYLTFVPDDADTTEKYAQALDMRVESIAERVRLILLMEQVLRAKPGEQEFRMRLVHNLILLDRIAEAIDHLHKLKHVWHDKAEVLHMLGWCQDAKKEYVQAVRSFEEAIKLQPKKIESYALLVEVLQERLNQPEEALKVMNDMVQANADSYQAYLLRARFQRRRGDEKAADSDLQTAHQFAPDRPEVILALADVARVKGNLEEATRLLQEGLKRHPKNVDLIRMIVGVKIDTGHGVEAIALARSGLANVPHSNELAILLIDLMIDQKEYAQARKKIDELMRAGLRPTLPNYLKARLSIAEQEWSEAIKLLEEVRRDLGPGSGWNSRVNVLLGVCYGQTGDAEQELQAFRRAVNDEPTWMVANVGLGGALLGVGRIDESRQTLEPLRTATDLPAGYWILLSRVRLARQMRLPEAERRWDEVEAALTEADKLEPNRLAAAMARADLLAARRDFAGAKTTLEKARAEQPDDSAVWSALADLQARQDRFDDAEKILDQAQEALGDRLELRLAKCRLWGMRGNLQDQAKLARLGQTVPSTYTAEQGARLRRSLAETFYYLGDWTRAEALWREVARAVPLDLRSRSMLLDVALEKHEPESARAWLDEIRKIEGDAGWLWRYGAIAIQIQEAHGRRSELEDARKKLQDLEPLRKMGPRLPLLAASIFELEGKHPQAIAEYMRALDLGDVPPRRMARLLELLIARREFGKAENELGRYEQKTPLTKDLARLGADIALGMRDKHFAKLAVARAESAVSLPIRDYRDGLWLARIDQAAGNDAKAEKILLDCLDQAGHAPDVWIAWMEFLTHTNQRTRAPKELARMTAELTKSRQPLTLARCYEALHQPEQAAQAYQDALQANPDDLNLLAFAADFHRRADQADEAQKLYQRLVDPALSAPAEFVVPARRQLAVLLAAKGADARKRALALLDDNTKTRGNTVADERIRLYVQSLTASTRQDALNRFQDSLRLEPPTPEERLLLARMLEATDQLGSARSQLAEAVDENPTPQNLARYVQMLTRTDDMDEAERQLARLDALEPRSDRARELRTMLDRAKKQPKAP